MMQVRSEPVRRVRSAARSMLLVVAIGTVDAGAGEAQSAPVRGDDSVAAVPGARYSKGWLHRQLFGSRYRTAWATSIRVPVLDLTTFAGGLKPLRRGGGEQTRSLRFQGADGRQYVFRSVDKDPIPAIDPSLRTELTEDIFQDQISAGHPTAPLAVVPILRAVGVLHAQPKLAFMPDDSALGEFRAEFANMLGMLEERPRDIEDGGPGFAGAEKIVDTEDLFEGLDEDPETRVSSRDFLTARLTDIFLGDWDRHRDQWQWALVADAAGDRWLPVPRDRDQAFIRYDGFVLRLLRSRRPQLVVFGPRYSPMVGATWNGRDLDRRLLTDLERPVWDSVARFLTRQITDSVIDAAVAALPPEHQRVTGPELATALRSRRDGLVAEARRFYDFLAGEVDVVGSDAAEVATVDRIDDELIDVELRRIGQGRPYFRRRLRASETNEIRIYLRGGADSAVVRGDGAVAISLKIVGGGGDDRFLDESRVGLTGFYDDRGHNESRGRAIDGCPDRAAADTSAAARENPPRDWGGSAGFFPAFAFNSNRGLLVGVGHRTTRYRFRRIPFASRVEVRAEYGFGAGNGLVRFRWERPFENTGSAVRVNAMLSGVEVARWYGFGNETTNDATRPTSYYWLNPYQMSIDGAIGWSLAPKLTLHTGVVIKYTITDMNREQIANRFIAADQPFGTAGFAQLGGQVGLVWKTRADDEPLTSAFRTEVDVAAYPALLDVHRPFMSAGGEIGFAVKAPVPFRPTLSVQLGGRKVFGTTGQIPFFEAAFLGSWRTLRGFPTHRFAGDAAIYGSAELRLQLMSLPVIVPARQGVFGFYDRGRVFVDGESSSAWHDGWGGGIWLAFRPSRTILTLAAGRSAEGTRIYLRTGFAH